MIHLLLVVVLALLARPLLLLGIASYQRRPRRAGVCRFEPTCSEYARLAIVDRGALRGSVMALGRLRRCRPPNGGVDWPLGYQGEPKGRA